MGADLGLGVMTARRGEGGKSGEEGGQRDDGEEDEEELEAPARGHGSRACASDSSTLAHFPDYPLVLRAITPEPLIVRDYWKNKRLSIKKYLEC